MFYRGEFEKRRGLASIVLIFATFLFVPAISLTVEDIQRTNEPELLQTGTDALATVIKEYFQEIEEPDICSAIVISDGSFSSVSIGELLQKVKHPRGVTVIELPQLSTSFNATSNFTSNFVVPQALKEARKVRKSSWCHTVVALTESLPFLEWLAEVIQQGRLINGGSRMVVLTTIRSVDLLRLLQGHWTFSMMRTVFINRPLESLGGRGSERWGVYYNLPYSKRGGHVAHLASWEPNTGLKKYTSLPVFAEKFDNFHGAVVNISGLPFTPYWHEEVVVGPDGKKIIERDGSDYLLGQAVADSLNFKTHILDSIDWTQVTDFVAIRKAFFCPNFHYILPTRRKIYAFGVPYEFPSMTFIYLRPTLKPQWQSLYYPLSDLVWISILITVLVIPWPIYLADQEVRRGSVNSFLTVVLGVLLGQSFQGRLSTNLPYRFILGLWLLFALVMSTSYRGNLTAFLTLAKYPPRPENMAELMETSVRLVMPDYGQHWKALFLSTDNPVVQEAGRRMDIVPSAENGFKKSTTGKFSFLGTKRYLELTIASNFTKSDGSNFFYVGRDSLSPTMGGWPIPHDAPYQHVLDRKVLNVMKGGLYDKWSRDRVEISSRKARLEAFRRRQTAKVELMDEEVDSSGRPVALTLTHVQGPLFILLLGWVTAFLLLLGEVFVSKYFR
ncbi:ionotropic receptor 21a-like [Oratosquilla oratoria]|uniref:ionotropic receptor 21a-like n=1 Tax=Oratosquilla oratoria TaxID=337810 RepID=UPI003F770C9D